MRKIIGSRILGLVVSSLVLMPAIASCQVQTEKAVFDYVFLLDTSGSMVGRPLGSGNPVIFPRVKGAIREFLEGMEPGANIFVYPFDEGIHDERRFEIKEKNDVREVQNYVDSLEAEGPNTWVHRSLKDAIDRIANFRGKDHVVVIYLYTDGLDTDPTQQYSMKDIMKYFSLKRGKHDWLYYCPLRVTLPDGVKRTLEETENVRLVEEENGPSPILLIETRIPLLDYSNLFETGESVRTLSFVIRNKEKLPPSLSISVDPAFPELLSMGVDTEVSPSTFPPKEKVELELSLINRESFEEEEYGEYKGVFSLSTNDPVVLVVPDEVEVKFTYQPGSIVTVSPPHNEKFPTDFGAFDVFRKREAVTKEKRIILDYNAQAARKGGSLKVYAKSSRKNPSPLTCTKNLIINNEKSEYVMVSPPTREVAFRAVIDKDLIPGRYEGTLNFESEDFVVTGEGLESRKDEPNVQSVAWRFTIPKPPLPLWKKTLFGIIGALVLLVIAIVVYCAVTGNPVPWPRRRATISNGTSLEVKYPEERKGEQIDLSGKREVKIGQDGEYFQDTNVSFTIKAVREGRKDLMQLSVKSGEVYLKKLREKEEDVVVEERIFDGDTMRFGNYTVVVSSFSLVRE